MMKYEAFKVRNRDDFLARVETLPRARVANYPWGCAYRPEVNAVLGWNEENIYLCMRAEETDVRTEAHEDNGDIYMDSCMEFFLNPFADRRAEFINFEFNPLGYIYIASGTPSERTLHKASDYGHMGSEIRSVADVSHGYWEVSAEIPAAFIRSIAEDFKLYDGASYTANFFKCGDGMKIPHFGCWSNIEPLSDNPEDNVPGFYRPDCFGEILFRA